MLNDTFLFQWTNINPKHSGTCVTCFTVWTHSIQPAQCIYAFLLILATNNRFIPLPRRSMIIAKESAAFSDLTEMKMRLRKCNTNKAIKSEKNEIGNLLAYSLLLSPHTRWLTYLTTTSGKHNFCYTTNSLPSWSTVLPEKLTGPQLVKKLPAFYGTRGFITAFTTSRYLPLSWATSIQSITPHPTS
jgi:hypothetical protein